MERNAAPNEVCLLIDVQQRLQSLDGYTIEVAGAKAESMIIEEQEPAPKRA